MGQSRSKQLDLAPSGSESTADSRSSTLDRRRLNLKKKWRRKKIYSLPNGLDSIDNQSNSELERDDLVTPHKGASLLAFSVAEINEQDAFSSQKGSTEEFGHTKELKSKKEAKSKNKVDLDKKILVDNETDCHLVDGAASGEVLSKGVGEAPRNNGESGSKRSIREENDEYNDCNKNDDGSSNEANDCSKKINESTKRNDDCSNDNKKDFESHYNDLKSGYDECNEKKCHMKYYDSPKHDYDYTKKDDSSKNRDDYSKECSKKEAKDAHVMSTLATARPMLAESDDSDCGINAPTHTHISHDNDNNNDKDNKSDEYGKKDEVKDGSLATTVVRVQGNVMDGGHDRHDEVVRVGLHRDSGLIDGDIPLPLQQSRLCVEQIEVQSSALKDNEDQSKTPSKVDSKVENKSEKSQIITNKWDEKKDEKEQAIIGDNSSLKISINQVHLVKNEEKDGSIASNDNKEKLEQRSERSTDNEEDKRKNAEKNAETQNKDDDIHSSRIIVKNDHNDSDKGVKVTNNNGNIISINSDKDVNNDQSIAEINGRRDNEIKMKIDIPIKVNAKEEIEEKSLTFSEQNEETWLNTLSSPNTSLPLDKGYISLDPTESSIDLNENPFKNEITINTLNDIKLMINHKEDTKSHYDNKNKDESNEKTALKDKVEEQVGRNDNNNIAEKETKLDLVQTETKRDRRMTFTKDDFNNRFESNKKSSDVQVDNKKEVVKVNSKKTFGTKENILENKDDVERPQPVGCSSDELSPNPPLDPLSNDVVPRAPEVSSNKRVLPQLPRDAGQIERAERILQLQRMLGKAETNEIIAESDKFGLKSIKRKSSNIQSALDPQKTSSKTNRSQSFSYGNPDLNGLTSSNKNSINVNRKSSVITSNNNKSYEGIRSNNDTKIANKTSNNNGNDKEKDPIEAYRSWLQRKNSNAKPLIRKEEVCSEVKTSTVVHEVERLRVEREARRARQMELLEEREARRSLDPGNPHIELILSIMEYQQKLEFKALSMHDVIKQHQITVCIRKRPLNNKEKRKKDVDVITCPNKEQVVVHEPKSKVDLTKYLENHHFRFDYAFDEHATNQLVYRYTAGPLVQNVFEGGFSTCFAYGQTGSGKTHTMGGAFEKNNRQNVRDGIYAMAADQVFGLINEFSHLGVSCSFFEIYGGKVFDLLNHKAKLRVLEDGRGQVVVQNLSEKNVQNTEDVLHLINVGNQLRTSGQTASNNNSSRSHAVFQIILRKSHTKALHGKFSLIDLAGNERGMDTISADRHTRIEGAEINKSLLALKECIRALGRRGQPHLPFRASKLTQVLRDSFVGESSMTCMIAMVSPGMSSCEHTLNTLRYADRVKELGADDPARNNDNDLENSLETSHKLTMESNVLETSHKLESFEETLVDDLDLDVLDVSEALAKDALFSEDVDLAELGSMMGPEWLSLQEALLSLEMSEESLLDAHHNLIKGMRHWLKEDSALLHLTDDVDYDQETYCRQLESLVDNKIDALQQLKAKANAFHVLLEQEEAISKVRQGKQLSEGQKMLQKGKREL